MESIRGKRSAAIDRASLAARAAEYDHILIDIGTGDGRYVRHVARTCPARFAIGVDACRENLREVSRTAPPNALFVIANALALPDDLAGLATAVTINFPWGSLLTGLLAGHPELLTGLRAIMRPGAELAMRLNESALAEADWPLADGGAQVRRVLQDGGFAVEPPLPMDAAALRACPTSWARRLATGRDPQALYLSARLCS
jgi:16S rRNA (adenine(1408)-N(1))-methyltransferase